MALFKKFKDDIGLDEEEKENEEEDKEKENKHLAKKNGKKKQDDDEDESEKNKKHPKKNEDWLESKGQLAADVYETENDFCIQAPVAGVNQEEIEIFVENNMLVIRGERMEPETGSNRKYYYKECYWGPFSRQTMLPEDANTQRISASFKKGVLTIKIPKKKVEKRKITIEMD
ncbi:MAG: Hsp20/alpha crystallin family protein [Candidatus Pacebacteria bacterium]|nr:Hsp20/alpha crystallin family protein [Candidatus Paceibacterota bacterium]